jgi:hypothetical protein
MKMIILAVLLIMNYNGEEAIIPDPLVIGRQDKVTIAS